MKSLALLLAGLRLASAVALPADASVDASTGPPDVRVPSDVYLEPGLHDQPKPLKDGAELKVLKYGPYRVPAMGSLENRMAFALARPCSSCYIVGIQANLIYSSSGKVANIDEGGWLHHMVIYKTGTGNRDAVCTILPMMGQRIFASGNERTPVRTNGGENKYGIDFKASDGLSMIYDLMNESKQAQSYYIEMTFETLPLSTAGYKPVKMAWLDITGCGTSDYPARAGSYEVKSPAWKSTISGRLLSATGHEHDGGTEVIIYKNGSPLCTSKQLYGRNPAWVGGMAGMKMAHISDTGSCVGFGEVKVGDSLMIGAKYNTTQQPLNKKMNGVGNAPIMGICQVYIG